ncbi:MAG: GDP-mannose 4,6-dehydratase [candidate division Zixibacteria bacterium]|nr:GDP-mannose 4,6-dehydratase [candidate division Zixibacteria bacterium]
MRKPHAFITGIGGFAGSFLAEELLNHGYRVSGALLKGESTKNIKLIKSSLELVYLDILDSDRTIQIVKKLKPDYIFHLAALASVGKSFSMERLTFRVNVEGTLNVLQAAEKLPKIKKMVFVSSADCYGKFSPKNKTLTESQPLNPISPYGISKATAEHFCRYYARRRNVPVTIARSFNHCGPRQEENFVVPDFARQIAAIELGLQKPRMAVGDLSAKRDFSDVRDIVRGYRMIAENGKPERAYQLCSGRAVSIQTVLNILLGFTSKKVRVVTDRSRLRKSDIPVLRGSNSRAVQELVYRSRYTIKTTLCDTYEYWIAKLSSN